MDTNTKKSVGDCHTTISGDVIYLGDFGGLATYIFQSDGALLFCDIDTKLKPLCTVPLDYVRDNQHRSWETPIGGYVFGPEVSAKIIELAEQYTT